MENMKELIFVYNANSSLFARVTDYAHKIISPATYQCNLCALTYGNLGMKQEWKEFIQKLPYKISFLHRDELLIKYPKLATLRYPAVFEITKDNIKQTISAQEINEQKTIQELEKLIHRKLV